MELLHHWAATLLLKLQVALLASDRALTFRPRDHTPGPASPVHSDIDRESSPLLPTNCLLPWERQFASRISTPAANFGMLRESASHLNGRARVLGTLLQHVGEVLAGMLIIAVVTHACRKLRKTCTLVNEGKRTARLLETSVEPYNPDVRPGCPVTFSA
jgi:hypothetical protein